MTTPSADLAWGLTALAFVTFMLCGIALYYAGIAGRKNPLNMIMMVIGSLAVTAVLYVAFVHGLVLGDSVLGLGLIGNPLQFLGMESAMTNTESGGPEDAWTFAFYLMFAAITVAIVSSGALGRMKFGAWLVFSGLWLVLVYAPVAHWVFAFDDEETGTVGGWLRNVVGLHDFAGGTAVHMNAGMAALALALVLGKRKDTSERPHNLPLVVLGGSMLFLGWFGFNGGSGGGATFTSQYAILTTILAACTGTLGYLLVEKKRTGRMTTFGLITGLIGGLVGITPCADAVSPLGALLVGLVAGALVSWAVTWKSKWGIDESLDAFAVHGVGGIAGTICVIFVGAASAPAGVTGIFFGGDPSIIWRELVAIVATCGYSFLVTAALAWFMKRTMGLRVEEQVEERGLDQSLHAESAYDR
ncbi:ammonium transporter [Galactobacter valiniphilus]|uniref:Ammonium transporter n=1 Tax=Galactobacter valiniphilus TaxID=2676122 RepID=A0A399JE23_9MICC|nr:ammonium transporter [Galactobacter valiniphilus]RII43818.1 ammonium transporter [Galactobacter valiniphilus]